MTDTITIELPREVAEAIVEPVTAKSLEFEFFGAESLVVAVQEALANPTRSDESELRGSVTIEEKDDGDWLCFSPPEGSFVMVWLGGIGGPFVRRAIRETVVALSQQPKPEDSNLRLAAEELLAALDDSDLDDITVPAKSASAYLFMLAKADNLREALKGENDE